MTRFLSIALASLLACGATQAATLSYSDSHGPDITDWDPAQTLSLQRFDPLLGTLNSVTFQFSGTMRADFNGTNRSASAQQVRDTLTGQIRFVLPTATVFDLSLASTQAVSVGGRASTSYSIQASDSGDTTLSTGLASFIGSGFFDLDVFAEAATSLAGSSNVTRGATTVATATARVTYDYTAAPVPEPASLALVGVALAAAGLGRRRAA